MSVDFKAKVYRKKTHAECIGRKLFLFEATRSRVSSVGPIAFTSEDLSIFEYFGLLMPVAKIIVPQKFTVGYEVFCRSVRNSKVSAYPANWNWIYWSQNRERWMFSICAESNNDISRDSQFVSGKILFQEDRDYWRALRFMPSTIRPELLQKYHQNPFDIPPFLLFHGNQSLDDMSVIPMYRTSDIEKCVNLFEFLHRPLSLFYSILAFAESQKRAGIHHSRKHLKHGVKDFASRKLRDLVWEWTIRGFDIDLENPDKQLSYSPGVSIDPLFYRNHYIFSYIRSLKNEGESISNACAKVATMLSKANPHGKNLSRHTIRKKIYYQIAKECQPTE